MREDSLLDLGYNCKHRHKLHHYSSYDVAFVIKLPKDNSILGGIILTRHTPPCAPHQERVIAPNLTAIYLSGMQCISLPPQSLASGIPPRPIKPVVFNMPAIFHSLNCQAHAPSSPMVRLVSIRPGNCGEVSTGKRISDRNRPSIYIRKLAAAKYLRALSCHHQSQDGTLATTVHCSSELLIYHNSCL